MAKQKNAKNEGFYIESLKIGKIQFVGRCGQVEEVFAYATFQLPKPRPATNWRIKMGQYITSYVPLQSDYDGNLCGRGTQDGHGGHVKRGCGVLLPISSLPNKYGFGCFSREAFEFVDYLHEMGMKYWQVLPLGPVDSCGSPYSSVSSFAGEPCYIDIEKILNKEEIEFYKLSDTLDFSEYQKRKMEALRYVFSKLYYITNIDKFIEEHESWVYDYAVYMVLKDNVVKGFTDFPPE